jgi:hypothetical protein
MALKVQPARQVLQALPGPLVLPVRMVRKDLQVPRVQPVPLAQLVPRVKWV